MLTSSDPLEFVQWYLHEYYPQVVRNPFIPDNLADLEKRLNEVILYWYITRYCRQNNQPPFIEEQVMQIKQYMEVNDETALPAAGVGLRVIGLRVRLCYFAIDSSGMGEGQNNKLPRPDPNRFPIDFAAFVLEGTRPLGKNFGGKEDPVPCADK